jgi:hypothetical protein
MPEPLQTQSTIGIPNDIPNPNKPVIGYTPPRYTDSIQTLPARTQGTGRGEGDRGI